MKSREKEGGFSEGNAAENISGNAAPVLGAIRAQLEGLAEPAYARFTSGLLKKPGESGPSGSAARMIGVRLPALRRLAKKLSGENWRANLDALAGESADERTFEEIMLQGFLIGAALIDTESGNCAEAVALNRGSAPPDDNDRYQLGKRRQETISLAAQFGLIRKFIPGIDNWSLCDSFCAGLKFAKDYPEETWKFLQPFLRSEEEYAVRFGLVMIISYFITETYIDRLFQVFDVVCQEGYYVKMANAWAVSSCYVRFPEKTQRYLEHNRLDDFTWQKALQKIVESRCISEGTRERIREMKACCRDLPA